MNHPHDPRHNNGPFGGSDTSSFYSVRTGSSRSDDSSNSLWSTSESDSFVWRDDPYWGYDGVRGAVTRKTDKRDDRRVRVAAHFLSGPFARLSSKKHSHGHQGHGHGHGHSHGGGYSSSNSSVSSRSSYSSGSSRKHRHSRPPSVDPRFHGPPPMQHEFRGPPPGPPPPPPAGFDGGFIQIPTGGGPPPGPPPPRPVDPVWGNHTQFHGPDVQVFD